MTTRRRFLQQSALLIGTQAAAARRGPARPAARAAVKGWHMAEENAPQARAFAFGAQQAIWEDYTPDVQAALGRIARAIAAFQPVTVYCRPEERRPPNTIAARPASASRKRRWTISGYATSARSSWPTVRAAWPAWTSTSTAGATSSATAPIPAAKTMCDGLDIDHLRSDLVGEGGGIETDGLGTAIMTESSWLNDNRNPRWTKAEIEQALAHDLGFRKIIWLPGIKGRDITDAHVDFYARFARPGVVVANPDMDPDSYDYELTRKHLDILMRSTDADGKPLDIHTLPPPQNPRRSRFLRDNPDFAAGYINYFVINGAVIAPEFGDAKADAHARELLERLYPGRKVVQLNIDAIASGGGGIHCVTNQMPAA